MPLFGNRTTSMKRKSRLRGRSGRGSQPGVEVRAGMAIRNVTEYDPALSDIVIKRQPAPIIDRVREDAWTEATKCVADQFR